MTIGVWEAFAGSGESHHLRRFTRGHIHETYLVEEGGVPFAVLQKINRSVFERPEALIANADLIEPFVRDQIAARMVTREGRPCHVDTEGEYWRAYEYLGSSRNLDLPDSVAQCFAAGRAFGDFQAALRDIAPERLQTSIKGFQHLAVAAGNFDLAVERDVQGRLGNSRQLANELQAQKGQAPPLSGPSGVVHGDCKFNNLLFDAGEDQVLAVLDLDTVMWHRRALDFGDLVRASAVLGREDDVNAELDLERVSAFAAGFQAGAGSLTPDTQALLDAILHVTFMLTLRFYADHLEGDVYFQVGEPGDNLRRAEGQWALFKQSVRRQGEILKALK